MQARRHLVFGGARSGKTAYALQIATALAQEVGNSVCYVATAEPRDAEMSERIARHRAERPPNWRTIESPHALASNLQDIALDTIVLVDCLTLWLSNGLLKDFDEAQPRAPLPTWDRERAQFVQWLTRCRQSVVLVSNEVGGGIVPASALARRFQDEQGWLNQSIAQICDEVTLVAAGLPMKLKSCGSTLTHP